MEGEGQQGLTNLHQNLLQMFLHMGAKFTMQVDCSYKVFLLQVAQIIVKVIED